MKRLLAGSLVLLLLAMPGSRANSVDDANAGLDALNRGDYATAVQLFTKALEAGELSAADRELAFVKRGQAYLGEHRDDLALTDLDQALKLDPADQEAANLLRQAKGTQSQQPASPEALRAKVAAEERAGQTDAANATLTAWLAIHPDDAAGLDLLGELDIAARRLDDAVTSFQRILALKPRDAIALYNLAWVYHQQHDPRALALARQAYMLMPNAQIADTFGWILTTAGNPDTGVLLLRQASAGAANDPRVQYHYAVALNDTGQKAEATRLLTTLVAAKAAFPEKPQAQQLLDALRKGR